MNSTLKNLNLATVITTITMATIPMMGPISGAWADEGYTITCQNSSSENAKMSLVAHLDAGGNPRVPTPAHVEFNNGSENQEWSGTYVYSSLPGLFKQYDFNATDAAGHAILLTMIKKVKMGRGGCGRGGCDQWFETTTAKLLVDGHEVFFGNCN